MAAIFRTAYGVVFKKVFSGIVMDRQMKNKIAQPKREGHKKQWKIATIVMTRGLILHLNGSSLRNHLFRDGDRLGFCYRAF